MDEQFVSNHNYENWLGRVTVARFLIAFIRLTRLYCLPPRPLFNKWSITNGRFALFFFSLNIKNCFCGTWDIEMCTKVKARTLSQINYDSPRKSHDLITTYFFFHHLWMFTKKYIYRLYVMCAAVASSGEQHKNVLVKIIIEFSSGWLIRQ